MFNFRARRGWKGSSNLKVHPGRLEAQRAAAGALTQALVSSLGSMLDSISVGVEEVAQDQWREKVVMVGIALHW
jgi:phenylpyruvate tautomerase PptA (4-oxalocrotonate tautomerase family)